MISSLDNSMKNSLIFDANKLSSVYSEGYVSNRKYIYELLFIKNIMGGIGYLHLPIRRLRLFVHSVFDGCDAGFFAENMIKIADALKTE